MDIVALLDQDYILSNSIPIFPKCGVYFLIKDNEIIYIGKSVTITLRLQEHKQDKDFDRVFFIACEEGEVLELEKRYIRKFAPRLNKKQNPDYIELPRSRRADRRFSQEVKLPLMQEGYSDKRTKKRYLHPEAISMCDNMSCGECGRLGLKYYPFSKYHGRRAWIAEKSIAACPDCGWSTELDYHPVEPAEPQYPIRRARLNFPD